MDWITIFIVVLVAIFVAHWERNNSKIIAAEFIPTPQGTPSRFFRDATHLGEDSDILYKYRIDARRWGYVHYDGSTCILHSESDDPTREWNI